MPLDLPGYRPRVGSCFCFLFFCLLSIRKLSFISVYSIIPFLILFFRGYPDLSVALLLSLFPVFQLALSFQPNKVTLAYRAKSECAKCKPSSGIFSNCIDYRTLSEKKLNRTVARGGGLQPQAAQI